MIALSIFSALMALHAPAHHAALSLDIYKMSGGSRTLVKSGDAISGEIQFRAVVQTDHPIQAVEFYVGDDLRESDSSTPYEFKLDTLGEEDGTIKVRFKAFTSEGQNAEKVLNLTIDNGISKGADYHVNKGMEYFTNGKFDDAITEGRIAQKADKNSLGARLLLANANLRKGSYDKAQKFAEDALEVDKNNRQAKEIIISLKVVQAFNAVSRTNEDRRDVIDSIRKGLSEAIKFRTSLLEGEVERLSGNKLSNEYLDAAIRARRYSLVIDSVAPALKGSYKNNDFNNRLAYAYLMTNQVSKADELLRNVKKFGEYDGYTFALAAVVSVENGNDTMADDMIKEALLNAPDSLGLRTAQAYIALKRDKPRSLADAANSLVRDNDSRSEAYYFAAALSNRLKNVEVGRKYFEKAIRADAIDHDMYIEQGNEAIALGLTPGLNSKDKDYAFEYARALYDLALQCRPSSGQALAAVALVDIFQHKYKEAESYGEAATKAAPDYAAAWYLYAAALSVRQQDARAALAKASALDARNLQGRAMPDANLAFRYFNTTGRTPVLSPPSRG